MSFKFEKLEIWKDAMDFGEELFVLSKNFPIYERFNLQTQILKAGDSIALNIAEGSIGRSQKEFSRYVGISIRSLAEVVTCLYKASHRGYITPGEFKTHYATAYKLMNMLIAFRSRLD